MAATYKLYYFNFWGRGEVCRLLLAASGQPWEDVRFTMDHFHSTELYRPHAPFGQAPFLMYGGRTYGQSVAIANFLAREFGMAGDSSLEALRNDEVVQLVQEQMQLLVNIHYTQDPAVKAQLVEKLRNEDVPRLYSIFNRLLVQNGDSGHFVGNKLSHADLAVYDMVTNTQTLWLQRDYDDDYPALRTLKARVEANVNISDYLHSQKPQPADSV